MKLAIYTAFTLLLLLVAGSCDSSEEVVNKPLIQIKVSPGQGTTAQVFVFDLAGSVSRTTNSSKIFSRWDWDGNGLWDTPLTRMTRYEHRYYAPGTWNARVEMVNVEGGSDTAGITVPVFRGYTAPVPVLKAEPYQGHVFTEFLLDASQTHDDEDSLDQLTFQWDFQSDGIWDTKKLDTYRILHQFPAEGFYQVRLQVEDPSGLKNLATVSITVTLSDPGLAAQFTYTPDSVTDNTPIRFDASGSKDLDNPDQPLSFRWDWNNDRVWDTDWLTDPITTHVFAPGVFAFVKLQIRSYRGLVNEAFQQIRVYHRNIPPRANFIVSTLAGNVNTKFRFDCFPSRDVESAPSQMFYRWDFDGDGQFEAGFSNELIAFRQYDDPGIYRVQLEVKDPIGDTGSCYKTVFISDGSNITGMFEDTRGYGYERYGTVKIGAQWWFARNVCLEFADTSSTFIYNNKYENIYETGLFYPLRQLASLCPPGWRVPTKNDWDRLFSNYPPEDLFNALMPGGISDFAASLFGKGTGWKASQAVYEGIYRYGYYWSATKPASSEQTSWVITFDGVNRKVLQGWDPNENKLYSVRCVKDAD